MKTGQWLSAPLILGVVATSLGCSSGEGPGGGSGGGAIATGSGGTTLSGDGDGDGDGITLGDGDIDLGGGATTGAGGGAAGNFDGGLVNLTPEQLAELTDGECAGLSEQAVQIPPVLQLVVDISDSMAGEAPGNEPATKWDVTQTALLTALDGLGDNVFVGLQFFPTSDSTGFGGPGAMPGGGVTPQPQQAGGSCVDVTGRVDIDAMGALGSPHRTALTTAIQGTDTYLGTPTRDAYVFSLEDSLKPFAVGGRKFMILITDGAPTSDLGCDGLISNIPIDHPIIRGIIDDVAAAHAEGIDTFVIGSPGSEDGAPPGQGGQGMAGEDMRPWMSEAAEVGGTSIAGCSHTGPNYCHFDMTQSADFSTALVSTLNQITMQVEANCDFAMPEDPVGMIDPDLTNVMITWSDGTTVLAVRDDMGECTDGWIWGPDGAIQLCSNTCAAYKGDSGGAQVTVSLGCEPPVR
jgi:hypothetical protein